MKNKTAIVIGGLIGHKAGGSSIGDSISIQLAKDGYNIVVVDESKMGNMTVEIIEKNGNKTIFIQADVTNSENAKQIIKTTKKEFNGLNCLVNCVSRYGSGMAKNIIDIAEEEWTRTLNVNLNGYFKICKYSIPLILESGGGTIINISSLPAFNSLPNFCVYSVSKAAINALTKTIAVDFAPKIRANAVCPGFVEIANSEKNRSPQELEIWYKDISKLYPMKRICKPEEIANVVSFLASNKSSYINGQEIIVDGGKMMSDSHDF